MKIHIAPSLLAADFTRLREEVRGVERGGADRLHLDVMDGHFVPNITFGPPVVAAVRKITRLILDAHLMIAQPEKFLEAFASAGADMITLHVEATRGLHGLLERIRTMGLKAGISLKPKTPLGRVLPYLRQVDLLLIMTVEPGFGGQSFMPDMLPKIRAARKALDRRALPADIAVDGGITLRTAGEAVRAGANVLVAGTAIFGQPGPAQIIRRLKNPRP